MLRLSSNVGVGVRVRGCIRGGVGRCVCTYVGVVGNPKENSSVALLANLLNAWINSDRF